MALPAGDDHTCAAHRDGHVSCWGSDAARPDQRSAHRDVPVVIDGLRDVVSLTAGAFHRCALRRGGEVSCWGIWAFEGACGRGGRCDGVAPWPELAGVVELRAALALTCGRFRDGTVRCAGPNQHGERGDGSSDHSPELHVVEGLQGAVELSARVRTVCARIADGTVRCWGWNDHGQCGDGTRTDRLAPVAVRGISGATQIAVGRYHGCALIEDRTVRCWGSSDQGRRGGDAPAGGSAVAMPTTVAGLDDVVALAAGWDHICAIRADGSVWCWGAGNEGQIGDGDREDRRTPVRVRWSEALPREGPP